MSIPFQHERYLLKSAKTPKEQRVSFRIHPKEASESAALDGENRLIYIVRRDDGTILYVGEAKGKLKERFQRGFAAYRRFQKYEKSTNGYRGYKWIELFDTGELDSLHVDAFIFDETYTPDSRRKVIESIEGELVFLVRKHTGKWPAFQNEIHFSNQTDAPETARKIYRQLSQS